MDTIELHNGMSIKCQALTKDEYETLKKNSLGAIRRFKDKYQLDVLQLNNNNVIVEENNYYTLYNSLEDLEYVLIDGYSNGSSGSEILLNKNAYKNDFPSHTFTLVKVLADTLNIINSKKPDEVLIGQIDQALLNVAESKEFKKRHLMNFIALIGEALRSKYHAEWNMKLATDGMTWNPYLVVNGKQVQFFTYLYEDIFLNDSKDVLTEVYHTVDDIIRQNL